MGGSTFTEVFGGNNIAPANPTYAALTVAANVTLGWPTELTPAGQPVVSEILDITATAAGFSISLSNATLASLGYCALFNNVGAFPFTVLDSAGNVLMVVPSGQVWQIYLANNSTPAGTWRVFQFGAGVSNANAASLAGAGLKAIATTLNEQITINPQTVNYNVQVGDRATCLEWAGGSGGTITLPLPALAGPGWFCFVQNSGAGTVNVTPAGGQLDGAASQVFQPFDSAIIVTDGTNYITIGLGRAVFSTFNFVQISLAGFGPATYVLAGANLNRISYRFTGALAGNTIVQVPGSIQQYWVDNETTGAFTFTVSSAGGGGTVAIPQGTRDILYCDGTNVVNAVSVATNVPGGVNSQVQYNNAGAFGGSGLTYQVGTGQFQFGAPSSGVGVTINGAANAATLSLASGSAAAAPNPDLQVQRAGSTLNSIQEGPNLTLLDTVGATQTTLQNSGGQTEIWQLVAGWHQLMFWNASNAAVFNAPLAGVAVTINGIANTAALNIASGSSAAGPNPDLQVARHGSIANQIATGPNLSLFDTVAITETILQNSGGQTEIWQFNGAWDQVAFWNVAGGLTLNAPTAGTGMSLVVKGANGGTPLQLLSGTTAGTIADFEVVRTVAGVANSLLSGPNLVLTENASNFGSMLQNAGGQTEVWQFNAAWQQLAFWNINRGLVLNVPNSGPALVVNGAAIGPSLETTGGPIQSSPSGVGAAFFASPQAGGTAFFDSTVASFMLGWAGGSLSTGTAAPALTANKPGASTAIVGWMSVTNGGLQGWVPVYGN